MPDDQPNNQESHPTAAAGSGGSGVELLIAGRARQPDREPSGRDRGPVFVLALVVALAGLAALTLSSGPSDDESVASDPTGSASSMVPTTTIEASTTATEPLPTTPLEVGEAWLAAIVDGDRERFVALHEDGFDQANETLMMWGWHSNRPGVHGDRYFDGYDAFRAALDVDDDEVIERGCRPAGNDRVFCIFRTTLIGGAETSGFGAVLGIDPGGLITEVRLDLGSTEPGDLFRFWPDFLTEEATERDVGCAEIGFNSVECGIQESNTLRRYIEYYRQRTNSG